MRNYILLLSFVLSSVSLRALADCTSEPFSDMYGMYNCRVTLNGQSFLEHFPSTEACLNYCKTVEAESSQEIEEASAEVQPEKGGYSEFLECLVNEQKRRSETVQTQLVGRDEYFRLITEHVLRQCEAKK